LAALVGVDFVLAANGVAGVEGQTAALGPHVVAAQADALAEDVIVDLILRTDDSPGVSTGGGRHVGAVRDEGVAVPIGSVPSVPVLGAAGAVDVHVLLLVKSVGSVCLRGGLRLEHCQKQS
jgi:hypothetical protein